MVLIRNRKYLIILVLLFIACNRNKLKYNDAKALFNKTIYPQKITGNIDLCIRYETKDEPILWSKLDWKKINDKLERSGYIKQQIIDSTILYYVQSQARYESRRHYLYKVIMSENIKRYILNSTFHSKRTDEYDYSNRRTARKDWLSCEVVCGELVLDTINDIDQKNGPIEVIIRYKERFKASCFNDLVGFTRKLKNNSLYEKTVTARKYSDEEGWKLIY